MVGSENCQIGSSLSRLVSSRAHPVLVGTYNYFVYGELNNRFRVLFR